MWRNWYYHRPVTTISLKIPDELATRLDAMARARHKSRSALFREALEEKLDSLKINEGPSVMDLAGDLCGGFSSGIKDLGSNPRHLDGYGL